MASKHGLLSLLIVPELLDIAEEFGIEKGSAYYKDSLIELLAESMYKRDVVNVLESYRPNYLENYIDERRRKTYIYVLKNGNEIVYYGISNDPYTRVDNHIRAGKRFTNWRILNGPMFRENAELMEWDYIQHYQDTHRGKAPKYNKAKRYSKRD